MNVEPHDLECVVETLVAGAVLSPGRWHPDPAKRRDARVSRGGAELRVSAAEWAALNGDDSSPAGHLSGEAETPEGDLLDYSVEERLEGGEWVLSISW